MPQSIWQNPGWPGNLTTRKYVGISGVSRATAWREIHDLVSKGLLSPLPGSGKRSSYRIVLTGPHGEC